MKHAQFGLNNAKTVLEKKVKVQFLCHVKKLTFKFLAQNTRTYGSWWFNITSSSIFPVKKF